MTRPILRVNSENLSDDEFATVEKLLGDLGVQGEELQPHTGPTEVLDALNALLVISGDSLHVVFQAMLASAGGAAGTKLVQLLGKLRHAPAAGADGQVISGRDDGGVVLVSAEASRDPDAMAALLHFDTGLLAPGDVLVWDPQARKWRRRE